jgi:hypothetical protein
MKESHRRSSFEQISMSLKYISRRNTRIIETTPRKLTTEDPDQMDKRKVLCNILNDKLSLTKSVHILMDVKGEYCLKLRFCSAVIEMEREIGDIMNSKAEKIVELFFKNSLFRINSITIMDTDMAISNNYHIIFIKNNIINELVNDEFFMDKIKGVIILKK